MKRFYTIFLATIIGLAVMSQNSKLEISNEFSKMGLEQSRFSILDDFPENQNNNFAATFKDGDWSETNIGTTVYDLQTNTSSQNRIYLHDDGSVGATWTIGMTQTSFPDRGTGYNFFDGIGWGPEPTERVESTRSGWPSYAAYNVDGEIIVSHSATTTGLIVNTNDQRDAAVWIESFLVGPAGNEKIEWPRMVTNRQDNMNIHIISLTAPEFNGGSIYNGMDGCLLYHRSLDGGQTWDIANQQFDDITEDQMLFMNGDSYAFADPKDNTLAFVVGSKWHDLFLMKSDDNGDSWEKTIIWEHPYPLFDWDVTITDTFYTCDASVSISLDDNGMAHVVFGLVRVGYFEISDEYTIFPFIDGLAYWNESMPAFESNDPLNTLKPDNLVENVNLIGWTQDVNGNGIWDIIGGIESIGRYGMGISSMPQITIDDENIYVLFSSLTETFQTTTQNYRHLWMRVSHDYGTTWNDEFFDLTGDVNHFFSECINPSMSPTSNDDLHVIYMMDIEPGLAVSGDEDPYGTNYMPYLQIQKSDVVGYKENQGNNYVDVVSAIYPNPVRETGYIDVHLLNSAQVSIDVYNILGQSVLNINQGYTDIGVHRIAIDVSTLKKGVYLYTVRANGESVTNKMVVE